MGKYTDQRKKYYDIVIAKYSEGMTAKEISKSIPVSKSTIYRWAEEYFGLEEKEIPEEMVIPRTPASVAKTIKAMAIRISELEKQVDTLKKRKNLKKDEETTPNYERVVTLFMDILKKEGLI